MNIFNGDVFVDEPVQLMHTHSVCVTDTVTGCPDAYANEANHPQVIALLRHFTIQASNFTEQPPKIKKPFADLPEVRSGVVSVFLEMEPVHRSNFILRTSQYELNENCICRESFNLNGSNFDSSPKQVK